MNSPLPVLALRARRSARGSSKPASMLLIIALSLGMLPSQVLAAVSPAPSEPTASPLSPTPGATPAEPPSTKASPEPSASATASAPPPAAPTTQPAPAPAPAAATAPPTAGPGALPPKLAPAPAAPKIAAPPVEDSEPMVEGAAVAGEVLDKRTEFSRTLKNKDGSFTVQSFTGPIHFKDKRGDWRQVEGALVASDKPGYAVRNKAHRFGVNIKDRLGPEAIELDTDQGTYTLSPEGLDKAKVALTESPLATGPPGQVRKVASFKQAAPGTDVEYQVTPTGLKETITLAGPESPSTFTYLLKGPAGTRLTQAPDGSLLVETAKGKRAFALDAPWAEEKAVLDQPQKTDAMLTAGGRNASMSSKPVAGGHLITVAINSIWLAAAEFPVVVDPTVTLIPGRDTIVTSGYPDSSHAGDGLISVGTSGTEVKRGLVGVDTSSIPVGSTVSAAWMYMRYDTCVSTGGPYACNVYSHQINAHRITDSWSEGNATWNRLDGQYDPGGPVGFSRAASEAVPNWNYWNLQTMVQQWVTGVYPNHGFMLKLADETLGRGGPCYLSRNTFYADQRPFMNAYHFLVSGITPEQAYKLFSPAVPNPALLP